MALVDLHLEGRLGLQVREYYLAGVQRGLSLQQGVTLSHSWSLADSMGEFAKAK